MLSSTQIKSLVFISEISSISLVITSRIECLSGSIIKLNFFKIISLSIVWIPSKDSYMFQKDIVSLLDWSSSYSRSKCFNFRAKLFDWTKYWKMKLNINANYFPPFVLTALKYQYLVCSANWQNLISKVLLHLNFYKRYAFCLS